MTDQNPTPEENTEKKAIKKIPMGTIDLHFAGDLIVPRLNDKEFNGLFRRFEALFETFANLERDDRRLKYMLINALILTAYAKKAPSIQDKKQLFNKKNELYLKIANDPSLRRKVAFKYLVSDNFRVLEYCLNCQKHNQGSEVPKHKWKFCEKCKLDRSFYNVLSMHHRFDSGFITLFLSNDLIPKISQLRSKGKGKLAEVSEEARFDKYLYNVKNMDAFSLTSALEMHYRLFKEESRA